MALISLKSGTADTIFNKLVSFFEKHNIPYNENMVRFASDGANVMFAQHNSVMSKLKKDNQHLFTMKCICHSFSLCASYACQKLPRSAEDFARDVYNYTGNSPKRIV